MVLPTRNRSRWLEPLLTLVESRKRVGECNGIPRVLATVPNCWVGSRSSSDPEPNCCYGSYETKTRTVAIGPVPPPNTRHSNITSLAPIKYMSSDRIVTWSIRKLCVSMHSFTSCFEICDLPNIRWVGIDNPGFAHHIWPYFTVIQLILVVSQSWKQAVKDRIQLHNLHMDHMMIRSELRYLIGLRLTQSGRNRKTEPRCCSMPAKNLPVLVWSG